MPAARDRSSAPALSAGSRTGEAEAHGRDVAPGPRAGPAVANVATGSSPEARGRLRATTLGPVRLRPPRWPSISSVDLAPDRPGGLRLAHPLLVAAGGAGYGVELMAATTALPAAIVTRGTTLRAHQGADPPRMASTPGGLVSAIGSPNPGVVRVLEQYAPRWAAWEVPVVLALCADDAAGFAALARAADARSGVAGLELHLGCQDLVGRRRGGKGDASMDPDAVAARVAAVRAETDLPVLAKLSGLAPDVGQVAAAAVEAGADAICAIDGLPGDGDRPRRSTVGTGERGRVPVRSARSCRSPSASSRRSHAPSGFRSSGSAGWPRSMTSSTCSWPERRRSAWRRPSSGTQRCPDGWPASSMRGAGPRASGRSVSSSARRRPSAEVGPEDADGRPGQAVAAPARTSSSVSRSSSAPMEPSNVAKTSPCASTTNRYGSTGMP